jgi:hypothetical protein
MMAAVEGIFEKDIVRLKREVEVPTENCRRYGGLLRRFKL